MQVLIWQMLGWIYRTIIVKFVIFTAVFALVIFLVPFAVGYLSNFISTTAFTSAFSGLPAGIWYFCDLFRLDYGVPLLIAAYVSRFLIRRLPVIG